MNEKVTEVKFSHIATAAPTICIIFTCLCFMFWANLLGFFGPGAGLTIGLTQLGMFGAYLGGSLLGLKSGDGMNGNGFLIFACFFGGVGAATNIGGYIAEQLGAPYCPEVTGCMYIVLGIFLILGFVVATSRTSITDFGIFFFVGVGVLLLGLYMIGALGSSDLGAKIVAWLLFADGVFEMWCGINVIWGFVGMTPHFGPALIKRKKDE